MWELAVSLILSMAVMTVFVAESKPIVWEVPKISLSIVAGIPITGKLNSLLNINPPVNVPSPPITIKPSILFSFKYL